MKREEEARRRAAEVGGGTALPADSSRAALNDDDDDDDNKLSSNEEIDVVTDDSDVDDRPSSVTSPGPILATSTTPLSGSDSGTTLTGSALTVVRPSMSGTHEAIPHSTTFMDQNPATDFSATAQSRAIPTQH